MTKCGKIEISAEFAVRAVENVRLNFAVTPLRSL